MGEDGPTRSPDWTVTPPLLLTLACATPGTGQITLVDFVDAEGHLEEDWSAKTATWTTTTDALELWVLDAPTGTFEWIGPAEVDHLTLNTDEAPCSELEDALDISESVLEGVSDGDPISSHCDALTTYFQDLEDTTNFKGERIGITAYVEELSLQGATAGSWGRGEAHASLYWVEESPHVYEGWDEEGCTLTIPDDLPAAAWYDTDVDEFTVDRAALRVSGSFEATVTGSDGATGTLTADFAARRCQVGDQPMLLISD